MNREQKTPHDFALSYDWNKLNAMANKLCARCLFVFLLAGIIIRCVWDSTPVYYSLWPVIGYLLCAVMALYLIRSSWNELLKTHLLSLMASFLCVSLGITLDFTVNMTAWAISLVFFVISVAYVNRILAVYMILSLLIAQAYHIVFPSSALVLLHPMDYAARFLMGGAVLALSLLVNNIYIKQLRKSTVQSIYDPVTGLPNRILFYERLAQTISRSLRYQTQAAVMFLDLDDFKNINDTLGHDVGDKLLIQVGRRLRKRIRETDTVSRMGGDEFTLIVDVLRSVDDVNTIAEHILADMKRPFSIGGLDICITASIGIAIIPSDEKTIEGIVRKADHAMYQSKERGKGCYSFFSNEIDVKTQRKTQLMTDMTHALHNKEFVMYFQPQIEILGTGARIIGAEALIRWEPKGGQTILPSDFIDLAEETGLILPIGDWVINQVCATIAKLEAHALHFRISANISPKQFAHVSFLGSVRKALESHAVAAQRLQLEIPESVLFHKNTAHILDELKRLGVLIALNDFGTGRSSLNALRTLPIDFLKIDKSLVAAGGSEAHKEMASAIISLSNVLEIQTITEGVETQEQLNHLLASGGTIFQGYLFSRPVAYAEFMDMASSREWIRHFTHETSRPAVRH